MPNPVRDSEIDNLIQQIDYANSTTTYYGRSFPGQPTSSSLWQIKRETLDSSGRTTKIEFAKINGVATADYLHVWDNRASLSFG